MEYINEIYKAHRNIDVYIHMFISNHIYVLIPIKYIKVYENVYVYIY
jgi:hypothetical protein